MRSIYFNNWSSQHLSFVRVSLTLILFAAIAQFASFGLIQAHVLSFYGAQPEDISFALQIAYVGIITTLPIQFRLAKYFNTRSYLLTAFLLGILLNIGCLFTHDLVLFSILRFLIGAITCIIAGCLLIVIFSTLPESKRMLVGVSLFFTLILTCGVIVGLGASWIVLRTNWPAVYYGMISLQIIAILLCIFIFKAERADEALSSISNRLVWIYFIYVRSSSNCVCDDIWSKTVLAGGSYNSICCDFCSGDVNSFSLQTSEH